MGTYRDEQNRERYERYREIKMARRTWFHNRGDYNKWVDRKIKQGTWGMGKTYGYTWWDLDRVRHSRSPSSSAPRQPDLLTPLLQLIGGLLWWGIIIISPLAWALAKKTMLLLWKGIKTTWDIAYMLICLIRVLLIRR